MSTDNPATPYAPQPAGMQPVPPQKSSTGKVLLIVGLVSIPILLVCTGILLALLLPAVQAAREAARRMQCSNNLKQIGLAMHNYHDTYGSLPPAYTVDENGQRLHSWRTLILPFMGQQTLYNSIDLSKPWNDPVNQGAADSLNPAYTCPSSTAGESTTTYVAVVDPSAVFQGDQTTQFQDITDGMSNTLMVVEVSGANAVPWMSPQDIDLNTYLSLTAGGMSNHPGGGNTLFADASVQFIASTIDPQLQRSMVTKDGSD
ncbi:DUF1559 domain-containing protein [Roseimaritima sediminicola]|uniref:DUF1559 domain-containing protein n=1 Tax=Roseimaritima sediminicola TaxID=2662066 RepID=UPI0012982BBC|nr:DUF1559 domain-containing protein [Roseimaritima sediminicola]